MKCVRDLACVVQDGDDEPYDHVLYIVISGYDYYMYVTGFIRFKFGASTRGWRSTDETCKRGGCI